MQHIKFTEDRRTAEAVPQVFEAGRVYALEPASCERWIKRGCAVIASQEEFDAQQAVPAAVNVPDEAPTEAATEAAPDEAAPAKAGKASKAKAAPQVKSASGAKD